MSHSVAFSPEAVTQLDDLEDYISDASSPVVAARFRHTTVIAFTVDSQTKAVSILGVFYGGKNYAAFIENDGH